MTDEALWTVKDVADFLRVSTSTVYHRAEAGTLPCFRVGALLRFSPEEIRAFVRGIKPKDVRLVSLRDRPRK